MTEERKRRRDRARGIVKSDRMDKTITVVVQRIVRHPLYGKPMRRQSRFMAHNPGNAARAGDVVEIEATRPLSRRKRWRLVRVIRRSAGAAPPVEEAPDQGVGPDASANA